jgi:LysM repeat protein
MHRRRFLQLSTLALIGCSSSLPSLFAADGAGEQEYVVSRGDTLSRIAKRHGTTVSAIKLRNGLAEDTIRVGQRLIIPAAAEVAAPAPAPTPASPGENPVLATVIAATSQLVITSGRWEYIVTHHAGLEDGNATSYDGAHRRRGMENGLAYHFVIGNGRDSGDGEIEIGPRWERQIHGGHVRSEYHNEHGIGICLVGNFEKRRPGKKQLASYHALVEWLRSPAAGLGVRPAVTVHRKVDKNHTVCPGKLFPYAELRKRYEAKV